MYQPAYYKMHKNLLQKGAVFLQNGDNYYKFEKGT